MRAAALALAFQTRRSGPLLLVLSIAAPVLAQPVPAQNAPAHPAPLDLREATIVVAPAASEGETIAADVLREEVASRTGLSWAVSRTWPARGPVVAVGLAGGADRAHGKPAFAPGSEKPEAYRLLARRDGARPVVWVTGADRRGTLFGVGGLLRALAWGRARATLPELDVTTAPRYPLRGHQLGYRQHSNTYDGWTGQHYDRYIRELALLGANAVENIPFQDTRPSPLMPISRAAMARRISEICAKYDQQYWLWTPADFDLADAAKRTGALKALDALFADLPRLDAIFLPGGDPGDNDATLVVPYLVAMSTRLRARHPQARIWLSLQHFDTREINFLFAWIEREHPTWLGGLVAGPGSYSLAQMRARLDRRYQVRDYPDVTHTVRSQYPVPWWDPALNLTFGREPINPRAVFYAAVHDRLASSTDGFITYSDGVNDDLNKVVWTRKAWDPDTTVRDIVLDYSRFFFGTAVAERAADGLLALERNWEGPLASNGGVTATLTLWQQLETGAPELAPNWRWQMCLLRAYYDAYTRERLRDETRLEIEANAALGDVGPGGSGAAMDRATAILGRASPGCCPHWRQRIEALCAALFTSIRMQTSVPKFHASSYERGAVLDFVDHPLNNRWWLEDEFAKVRALGDEPARLERLEVLRTWDTPGPGSFYDDIGSVAAAPHVRRAGGASATEPEVEPTPHFAWEGKPTRRRLSWVSSMRWPRALVYEHLDPSARYRVRLNVMTNTAAGQVALRIDDQATTPLAPVTALGDRYEYVVPAAALADGRLVITFDSIDESQVNWRLYSRLTEAWLIRQDAPADAAREAGAR